MKQAKSTTTLVFPTSFSTTIYAHSMGYHTTTASTTLGPAALGITNRTTTQCTTYSATYERCFILIGY